MRERGAGGIRGPTAAKKATGRAGNAAGGGKHRDGSGINHPSQATSGLEPASSVGRGGMPVKIARCVGARERGGTRAVGAVGNAPAAARAWQTADSRRGTPREKAG